MATIAQQKDEDNKNNPAGGPTTVSNTGGGASNSPQAGQGPVQQNAAPQASQGYTDVASYLNANQAGSADLGQRVSSNLNTKYNDTKSGIDTSFNQFKGDVTKGSVPQNTDLINQVAANPNAAVSDPNKVAAFQGQLNAKYTGPTSWADQGTQQGKVNSANQYADLASTPGGLNVYTQEAEAQTGGPQSQGINQLDTLLLGGDPGAMGQVNGAASQYKSLNDYINAQNMAGSEAVTGAQNEAQNTAKTALNAFTGENGTLTNLNTSVNQNASKQLAEAQAQQTQLAKDLGMVYNPETTNAMTGAVAKPGEAGYQNSGYLQTDVPVNYSINNNALSDSDLSSLGLSRDQWNSLSSALGEAGTSQMMNGHNFGQLSNTSKLDLGAGLTQADPTQRFTAANTATADQYAQMSAIQQLLGDKTPQGGALNPALSSLAGTANSNGLSQFDYEGALQAAKGASQGNRQEAQDIANYLTSQANAKHDAGKGKFLNGLEQAAGIINPVAYLGNKGVADQGKKLINKWG